jgi:lysozyme
MANWPGDAAVLPLAEPIIKQWEGLYLSPYLDIAGIPTIGWGTIAYPNGEAVTLSDPPITQAYAEQCLTFQLSMKSVAVENCLTRDPTAHQAAAMLSLTYNIGVANFSTSTVVKQFNAGNIQAAANAFLLWDKAHVNGVLVVIPGLLNRRKSERAVFLTPDSQPAA